MGTISLFIMYCVYKLQTFLGYQMKHSINFKSHFLRKAGKISIFEEVTLFKFAHHLFVGEDSCTNVKTKNSFKKIHFVFKIMTPKFLVIFERFSFLISFV